MGEQRIIVVGNSRGKIMAALHAELARLEAEAEAEEKWEDITECVDVEWAAGDRGGNTVSLVIESQALYIGTMWRDGIVWEEPDRYRVRYQERQGKPVAMIIEKRA